MVYLPPPFPPPPKSFLQRHGFNNEEALAHVHFHKIQLSHEQELLQKRLPRVSLLSDHHYHYHNCYHYHHHYDHYEDYDHYSHYYH